MYMRWPWGHRTLVVFLELLDNLFFDQVNSTERRPIYGGNKSERFY